MSLPFTEHFDACLPQVAGAVRITSLADAQVFTRRWCIRDKDRDLKVLLKRLERVNSSDKGYDAIRDFKAGADGARPVPGRRRQVIRPSSQSGRNTACRCLLA